MTLFAAYRHWRPTPLLIGSTIFTLLALSLAAIAPELALWAATAIAANILLLTSAGLWPRCRLLGPNWTSLPSAAAKRGEIALTIDDGPNSAVTPAVLDLLDRYNAKATFFCIAENALKYPDLCREISARGHAVENHTLRHRHNFSLLMPNGYFSELNAAQAALSAITGVRPAFFRAPAGLRNPLLDPVLSRLGLQLVSWTRRGFDTLERDPQRVLAKLLAGLKAGDILLLHDGNAALTASGVPVILEVLPALLEAIANANLRTITLGEAHADLSPG
jgi:peptidoglycan/xylan/chitin deacetylase (PgdA/CDA1 family)